MTIEKEKKDTMNKSKISPNYYSDKIFDEFNKIINDNPEILEQEFQQLEDKIFRLIKRNDMSKPKVQKAIFEQIMYFFNNFFWKVKLRKIYNNIPKTNLNEFSKKNIWTQIFNNSYKKEWGSTFIQKEAEWGCCWHWAIIFTKTLDKFKKLWLNIKSQIFKYDWPHGHTWVAINFYWEDYIFDYFLINEQQEWYNVISSINELNKTFWAWVLNSICYDSNSKKIIQVWGNNIYFFDTIDEYLEYQNKLETTRASIGFNIWKGQDKQHIKLDFLKDRIFIEIQKEKYQFIIKKSFLEEKDGTISDEDFFDKLITEWITEKNNSKKWIILLKRYTSLIKNKINLKKIRNLYKFK